MLVRIRLQRLGRKDLPMYRVVAIDSRRCTFLSSAVQVLVALHLYWTACAACRKRDSGKYLEKLGSFNPHADAFNSKEVILKNDRI